MDAKEKMESSEKLSDTHLILQHLAQYESWVDR